MSRRLIPLVAVLVLAAPAFASPVPTHGHYAGTHVSFHYAHGELVGFKFGTVHACPQAWVGQDAAFTCHHNGKFTIGHWTSATHVTGEYVYHRQTSRGTFKITHAWSADLQQ